MFRKPFWAKPDGTLDMPALMRAFQAFWRENSGADRDLYGFKEATPHLVFTAFLQRVVNDGGRITREMAIGRKRLDKCAGLHASFPPRLFGETPVVYLHAPPNLHGGTGARIR